MREIKFRLWDKEEEIMRNHWTIIELSSSAKPYGELMQFTGLKDKNGKEIYEGDIVNLLGVQNYEVKFIKGGFAVDFKDGHRYLGQFAEMIIIGNIYENPELLETIIK